MKTVMVFGTFDHLHPGHMDLFRQAREHGDRLIVVVGRNKVIKEIKGYEPEQTEEERLDAIVKTGVADMVLLGSLDDRFAHIRNLKPDVICLGYDQRFSLAQELPSLFPDIKLVRLEPFHPEQYKSSLLRRVPPADRNS